VKTIASRAKFAGFAEPAPVIHYAPAENLAALDRYAGRTMQVEPTWNGN
jgi:hypothetical protein